MQSTESDLRAAMQVLHMTCGDGNPAEPLLRSALGIGLNLIDAVRSERKLIRYPVMSAVEDENARLRDENFALKELAQALVPLARISEGLWNDIAQCGTNFRDMNYRQRVMTKLGSAIRRFHVAMGGLERRGGLGEMRNVA
ncbi:MAG: hypothetical protein JST22_03040 [Bacteroidetes bacterium]|nr:hypothetical protein [Bacteroidota bacterium]